MTETDTIDAQLLDLMLRAGSRWILWLLILLSLAAVAVMIERVWFFLQERPPAGRLAATLHAMRDGNPALALSKLAGARSMEAAVVRTCLQHAGDGASAVEDHKAAAIETERLRYEKRLAFLGTLGNNAPFVGLFGTVLGIIRAFHDLAGSAMQGQGTQAVMSGIAEALVATGVGLLVALPSVAMYNVLIRHVETATAGAEAASREIIAYIKTPPAAAASGRAPGPGPGMEVA
ncbi:MAG TPA: MotA/TolQ/ExbB proton channel family protein [Kofleriaceae bacterium]|jgi:biopolymer transport protein ExbB|nr:MotA/TolQ/ExbB proton channel family protein [Kofleriaceae bacterium]